MLMKTLIADMIREARNEQDVYQLLNAYIEEAGYAENLSYLGEGAATVPSSTHEVMRRCAVLVSELDTASKRLDDKACLMLKEALHVFSNAAQRLTLLEREKQRPLAAYVARHGNWRDSTHAAS